HESRWKQYQNQQNFYADDQKLFYNLSGFLCCRLRHITAPAVAAFPLFFSSPTGRFFQVFLPLLFHPLLLLFLLLLHIIRKGLSGLIKHSACFFTNPLGSSLFLLLFIRRINVICF